MTFLINVIRPPPTLLRKRHTSAPNHYSALYPRYSPSTRHLASRSDAPPTHGPPLPHLPTASTPDPFQRTGNAAASCSHSCSSPAQNWLQPHHLPPPRVHYPKSLQTMHFGVDHITPSRRFLRVSLLVHYIRSSYRFYRRNISFCQTGCQLIIMSGKSVGE